MQVAIWDRQVDETWLAGVLEEVWNMVKAARRKSSRTTRRYVLWFGVTAVEITVRQLRP
jgi:hypothetical protein